MPIFIIVFYNYHFDKLEEDEEFKDKYGTVMEGLDPKKRSSVAYVAMFAVRRILFMCASLFLFGYNMVQLPIMSYLTIMSVSFLITFRPYEDKLVEKLDIMNEIILILLIDICYLFTDLYAYPVG